MRSVLAALLLGIASAASALPAQAQAVTGPDDVSYWRSALRAAPLARESQWVEPGILPTSVFGRPLLLPPRQNDLLDTHTIVGAGAGRSRAVWDSPTNRSIERASPWYTVMMGSLSHGFPAAKLDGWTGNDVYVRAAQPFTCESNASDDGQYCWIPGSAADDSGLPYGAIESFSGLTVGASPAIAVHQVRPVNTPDYWSLVWYDSTADVTYSVWLGACGADPVCTDPGGIAALSGPDLSPAHREAAERLAAFASTFMAVLLG